MKNSPFFLLIVLFLLFTNYYFLTTTKNNGQVQSAYSISKSVETTAFIGFFGQQYRFSIFGVTSPHALVTIEGIGIYDQTYADKLGNFEFVNRFSPITSREACLTAQDQFGRITQPTCLPPFSTNNNVRIGPVIIPPTLSLDRNDYYIGDEILLSGQTVPNSEVNLSMFTKEILNPKSQALNKFASLYPKRLKFSIFDLGFLWDLKFKISNFALIKPVEAFTFPELQTKADKNGNFSISLPSSHSDKYRFFAQTLYDKSPSAQSTTLNLNVLPIWMIIFKILWLLLLLLKPKFIELIIITELFILLLYIFRRYFRPHIIARNRSLILRENLALLNEDKTLEVRKKYALTTNF